MTDVLDVEALGEIEDGKIISIEEPVVKESKFGGNNYQIPIVIELKGTTVKISVFAREAAIERGVFSPRSNISKLLAKYKCKTLRELIGKDVSIRHDGNFYQFVV